MTTLALSVFGKVNRIMQARSVGVISALMS